MTFTYPKLYGPFKRATEGPDRNKLIIGNWNRIEFEYLKDNDWIFTEKVDGTNTRVIWDGHKVRLGGRTERAVMPKALVEVLDGMFPEELMEQTFEERSVILYGEGYGPKINGGGKYRDDLGFVLFDVLFIASNLDLHGGLDNPTSRKGRWATRETVEGVAKSLSIDVVPILLKGTLDEGMDLVQKGLRSSWNPDILVEGLVGTTSVGLLNSSGERIVVKIKTCDFRTDG